MKDIIKSASRSRVSKILVVLLAIIYVVSPIDVVPDIPPLGWIDDIVVLLLMLLYVMHGEDNIFTSLFSTLKWLVVLGGILTVVLLFLLATIVISLCK